MHAKVYNSIQKKNAYTCVPNYLTFSTMGHS